MKFTKKDLEDAFNTARMDSCTFEDFFNSAFPKSKKPKVQKPLILKLDEDFWKEQKSNVLDDLGEISFSDEPSQIKQWIEKIIDEDNYDWADLIYNLCGDDLPDEGLEFDHYILFDQDLWKISASCTSQWCGDWSVRANLVNDITIHTMENITSSIVSLGEKSIILKRADGI